MQATVSKCLTSASKTHMLQRCVNDVPKRVDTVPRVSSFTLLLIQLQGRKVPIHILDFIRIKALLFSSSSSVTSQTNYPLWAYSVLFAHWKISKWNTVFPNIHRQGHSLVIAPPFRWFTDPLRWPHSAVHSFLTIGIIVMCILACNMFASYVERMFNEDVLQFFASSQFSVCLRSQYHFSTSVVLFVDAVPSNKHSSFPSIPNRRIQVTHHSGFCP